MNDTSRGVQELIRLAQSGDREALADLLEQYRPRLARLAQLQMDDRLANRLGVSDLVQQTILSAFNHFPNFDGSNEAEFLPWLEQIHKRNAFEAARHHVRAQKRAVTREQLRGEEQTTGAYFPAANAAMPSRRAIRVEEDAALLLALDKLPTDQREAVRLKYLDDCTLAEIAEKMGRSIEAAAGLLKRGLKNLRKHIDYPD